MFLRTAAAFLAISAFGANASEVKIAGYEPTLKVTDHNAIDLDQKEMETALSESTDAGFALATKIYSMGGNSKSYAQITIPALEAVVKKGAPIKGVAMDNESPIEAKSLGESKIGDTFVQVQYPTLAVQDQHLKCKVGGLPTTSQVTTGCFAENGALTIDGKEVSYTAPVVNKNARTIQGFSTAAKAKMNDCDNGCPYPEPKKYFDYFGDFDYADKWIMAGLTGQKVEYKNGMSFDFSMYGPIGKTEVVKKGTVYLNFYMYVIRELYDAIGDCEKACNTCNDDAVHAWDEAVAYYTGSLEGPTGEGDSKLLYELAQKRCSNFKTCGKKGDTTESKDGASANYVIFDQFNKGKKLLEGGKCADVKPIVEKIIATMGVPMVQGALRYAWKVDNEDSALEKKNAEGIIFTMAVLPRVDACDKVASAAILKQMQVSKTYDTNFTAVKKSWESVYECMGLTCAQIGGLINTDTKTYYTGAGPCVDVIEDKEAEKSAGTTKTVYVALVTALIAAASYF